MVFDYLISARKAFVITFILCLFAGLMIIYVIGPALGISRDFGKSNDGYIQLAENIGRGNGYVFEPNGPAVFHRPPLYPLVLVPVMLLPKVVQWPALILLQSLLAGGIAAFIFKLAENLFSKKTAFFAVIIFLLNPWLYWLVKVPMTPILQGFLYITFIWLIISNFIEKFSIPAGLTAAALSLTHGAMLPAAVILLFIAGIAGLVQKKRQLVISSIAAFLIMSVCIAPWTYRNYKTFGRFIPVVSGSGLAYFNGNVHFNFIEDKPQQKGESYIDASLRVAGIDGNEAGLCHWKGLKDIRLDEQVNQAMKNDIKSHPGRFMLKVLANAVEYYWPGFVVKLRVSHRVGIEEKAITIFNFILWLTALAGICISLRQKSLSGIYLLLLIILYAVWYFPFATFIGHNLYTFATMPLLSIPAAITVGMFFDRTSQALHLQKSAHPNSRR